MDYKAHTLEEIAQKSSAIKDKKALIGFDGFVDKIMRAVDKRSGPLEDYTSMTQITDFGARISAAAGKSTNIELYPAMEKLGGNGPIMANALMSFGLGMRYIGTLGKPAIQPVFEDFAARSQAISVTEPGVSIAVEFHDGKIILGIMEGLHEMTYDAILEAVGRDNLINYVEEADLFAILNWTMLPFLSQIEESLLEDILPHVKKDNDQHLFFDLCDPEKRAAEDILQMLKQLRRFSAFDKVTLGLNYKESHEISRVLGLECLEANEEGLKAMCLNLQQALEIDTVLIHPTDSAACATNGEAFWVPGPYCEQPLITTGAGDHFNAGFMAARLLGFSPSACLTNAVCTSGCYVRTAKSPTFEDITALIQGWK